MRADQTAAELTVRSKEGAQTARIPTPNPPRTRLVKFRRWVKFFRVFGNKRIQSVCKAHRAMKGNEVAILPGG